MTAPDAQGDSTDMLYEHIFFDLDGTLSDPSEGIANGIMYAQKKWGLPCGPRSDYYKFIGPPMPQSFCDFLGFSHEDAVRFLACFREYYSVTGIFENRLFDGMAELLHTLKAHGAKLYVATTKPQPFADRLMEHFGIADCFACVSGCGLDGLRNSKREVIEYARDSCGVDMTKAVLIGDRMFDAAGARECGIPCVGVEYGFGGREELEAAGAVHVVATVEELGEYLLG